MTRQAPVEIIEFIKSGSKFIVAGHKEPDGDCAGSQLALCSALRRLGKEAIPCSAGPFKRSEIMPLAEQFLPAPAEAQRGGVKAVIVDCSSLDRTGDLEAALKGLPLAVIDHHAAGKHAASAGFLDPDAPSTTVLIFRLIEALGLPITAEEAQLLFLGLCTDTGFFRHLDSGGAEVLADAARLIAAGASPKKTYQAINGGKTLNSRILTGLILSRAEAFFGGRLIVSFETGEDIKRFGLESRDSDAVYQFLQSVAGAEAVALIRQETPDKCTVGLRSRDAVDVGAVAESFGGGGHKNAAGFSAGGLFSDIKPEVIKAFESIFQ